jgi:hypothetical protein
MGSDPSLLNFDDDLRLGITAGIGAGGMAEVFRATDSRLGRDVATKFSTEQFGERFEREAANTGTR